MPFSKQNHPYHQQKKRTWQSKNHHVSYIHHKNQKVYITVTSTALLGSLFSLFSFLQMPRISRSVRRGRLVIFFLIFCLFCEKIMPASIHSVPWSMLYSIKIAVTMEGSAKLKLTSTVPLCKTEVTIKSCGGEGMAGAGGGVGSSPFVPWQSKPAFSTYAVSPFA